MNNKEIEKYLFDRYKYYVKKCIDTDYSFITIKAWYWKIVEEFQDILNKFFHYDFPYHNNHYEVIKNEKTIYEYDL